MSHCIHKKGIIIYDTINNSVAYYVIYLSIQVQKLVSFRLLDATMAEFPENHFDVVYSRDAIMHIAKKQELYEKVFVSNEK